MAHVPNLSGGVPAAHAGVHGWTALALLRPSTSRRAAGGCASVGRGCTASDRQHVLAQQASAQLPGTVGHWRGRGAPWPPARPGSAAARPSRHPHQPCRPRRPRRPCARRPRPPAQGPRLPRPGRLRPRPWPPCMHHSRCGRLLTGSTAVFAELTRGWCMPSASCEKSADVLQLACKVPKCGTGLWTQ